MDIINSRVQQRQQRTRIQQKYHMHHKNIKEIQDSLKTGRAPEWASAKEQKQGPAQLVPS